ncbi:MAG: hypothetical protein HY720_00745 [Planctomycetes bacterium]|nr:hypothetical protein [Planctomycetota bacterium]
MGDANRVAGELHALMGRLAHISDLRFTAARWEDVLLGSDDRKSCVGILKIPNGWRYEEYDEVRRWAAEQTERLSPPGRPR